MLRGEVWIADLGPIVDNRQSGRRPAVLLQNDVLNRSPRYTLTILVPGTTRVREGIPTRATLDPDGTNGPTARTDFIGENIQTLPKSKLVRRLGNLSSEDLARVEAALRAALGLRA